MNFGELYDYAMSKRGATEGFPFGPTVLVLKVGGKMFALLSMDSEPATVNLKCDPDQGEFWREQFRAVAPGFHQNKKYWNTVTLDSTIPEVVLKSMVDHSYEQVLMKLKKADREKLLSGD